VEVPLILHLSDLHLLPKDSDEPVGDYRSGFVPPEHRQKRVDLLVDTLHGLREKLNEDEERLEAIVISGDVTTRGARAGFEMLPDLLGNLGDQLPDPGAIVVVPGNHDAAYGTPPSSPERYKHFMDLVRAKGYVTPILEGVDDPQSHVNCLVREHFVICAVNSADYAGAVEPLDAEVETQLTALRASRGAPKELLARFDDLRLVDAARINPMQLRHMADNLRAADPGHQRVRIVTFHHQLQPVTLNEELKPFESLSNLAEVQTALRDSEVDVILHGHKHAPALLDLALPFLTDPNQRPHPCRVVSVGTVGGQVGVGNEVAKLLRIDAPAPRTRTMTVYSVPALSAGGRLGELTHRQVVVSSPAGEPQHTSVVYGRTIADVHEQIILPAFEDQIHGPVICILEEANGVPEPPATYPTEVQADNLTAWFEGQVRWWQSDAVAEGKPFTHGDYIRRWHGVRDQLQDAVRLLRKSPHTSRALVTLYDPDRVEQGAPFPSFSVLHLKVRGKRLEMFAFFRKHEMRYWWAINVAEIALIQAKVIAELSEPGREITAGPIVTVSAEAVFSKSLPKVAVPQLDQHAWNGSPEVARIATAIFDRSMTQRGAVLRQAVAWFEELAPPQTMPNDGPYVAIAGPAELLKFLLALQDNYPSAADGKHELIERLESFVEAQKAGRSFSEGDEASGYPEWASRSRKLLSALTSQLNGMSS
jgi:hypothetical protein